MKTSTRRLLFWVPRILGLLFALFISLFALDVFEEGRGFGETVLALLIHLIPTAILLLVLALAWHWEWVGGLLYPLMGVFYIIAAPNEHWTAYLLISGPLFLLGILFLLDWRYGAQLHFRPGI